MMQMPRMVAKATQLSLFGDYRAPVKAPGSKGGKWYATDSGKVRYGEKPPAPVSAPTPSQPHEPMTDIVVRNLPSELDTGPDGQVDQPPAQPREAASVDELHAGIDSVHRSVVQAMPGGKTRMATEGEQTDRVLQKFDDKLFIEAGKATFTVPHEGAPRGHYTYRINKKDDKQRGGSIFFAALLTGPDNVGDYQYLGIYDPATCSVRVTGKSRFRQDSEPVQALSGALAQIKAGAYGVIHHAGKCARCGRMLTVPHSVEVGFGPECEGRAFE